MGMGENTNPKSCKEHKQGKQTKGKMYVLRRRNVLNHIWFRGLSTGGTTDALSSILSGLPSVSSSDTGSKASSRNLMNSDSSRSAIVLFILDFLPRS